MDKSEMLNHIKHFRGSSTWICGQLKISKSAFSHWLHNRKTSQRLEEDVPPLVELLIKTQGACMFEANGPSVRSQISKLRRRYTGNRGKVSK
jgi:hypothetical protein